MKSLDQFYEPLYKWVNKVHDEPEVTSYIPGFVPTDAAILVSGRAKLGMKSWFAKQTSLCMASGMSCSLLVPTGAYKVFYVDEEGARKPAANRFDMLEIGSSITLQYCGDNFLWAHRQHVLLDDAGSLNTICNVVKEQKVNLVVLDTLAKISRADENSAKDIGNVMRSIDKIRDSGASVMFLHHVKKFSKDSSDDPDEMIRGSSALEAFYDVHLAFRRDKPSQAHLDLTVRSREAEEKTYCVTWDFDAIKNSASLSMSHTNHNEVSQTDLDRCIGALLPGVDYSTSMLKTAWDMPSKILFERALVVLLSRDILLKAKKGFELNVDRRI